MAISCSHLLLSLTPLRRAVQRRSAYTRETLSPLGTLTYLARFKHSNGSCALGLLNDSQHCKLKRDNKKWNPKMRV